MSKRSMYSSTIHHDYTPAFRGGKTPDAWKYEAKPAHYFYQEEIEGPALERLERVMSELDKKDKSKKENDMNESPTNKLSNAIKGLSKSERLLRKYNVVDECGDLTHIGQEMLLELLFKENRGKLVELAEGIEKEDNKKK